MLLHDLIRSIIGSGASVIGWRPRGQSPCCGDLVDLISHQQLDLAYGQTLQELVNQRARGGRELLADRRRWA